MSKYARRTDGNQKEIVQGLRDIGLPVKLLSHCPSGALDFITGHAGILYWVEVKKSSKDDFTPAEQKTIDQFRGYPVLRIWSLQQLLERMGVVDGPTQGGS